MPGSKTIPYKPDLHLINFWLNLEFEEKLSNLGDTR